MGKNITLVIGGCKSGKSRHALKKAENYKLNKVFIATCQPFDDEMKQRINKHKAERNHSWISLDVPIHLPGAVSENGNGGTVLLIDCLTLWISNLLMIDERQEFVERNLQRLRHELEITASPVILVSNEVGTGIVPENRLARLFRDIAGLVNQEMARIADEVIYMVAGLPMWLKGKNG